MERSTLTGETNWGDAQKRVKMPDFIGNFGLFRVNIGKYWMSAKKIADGRLQITKDFLVCNKLGIHARPAALFVKTANRFICDIFVEKDGDKVNGKSIMGLMMLAAGQGTMLVLSAEGADADKALQELELLIETRFDEE